MVFLKRLIEVDKETHIWLSEKYAEGLVGMFHGVKRRRTPGEIMVDDTLVEDPEDVSRFRSAVGALLYIAGDRPDLQFHTKELAGRLQKPTIGAMATLRQVIGYLVGTSDIHAKMTGRDPSRSFREQAQGVSPGPQYENAKEHWLLEVATGSDWNGSKQARASTSCGSIFIGGNWIYSYSRMQKCVTLSSTEAEYIALVSGGSEGLLVKAVLQHLTRETVDLKVYSDNTSCVAVAQKALATSNILMAGCFGCNNAKEEIWSCDAWTRSPTLQIWAQRHYQVVVFVSCSTGWIFQRLG